VTMPFRELVKNLDLKGEDGDDDRDDQKIVFADDQDACYITALKPIDDTVILGGAVMRYGYYVFDFENNMVAMVSAAESPPATGLQAA